MRPRRKCQSRNLSSCLLALGPIRVAAEGSAAEWSGVPDDLAPRLCARESVRVGNVVSKDEVVVQARVGAGGLTVQRAASEPAIHLPLPVISPANAEPAGVNSWRPGRIRRARTTRPSGEGLAAPGTIAAVASPRFVLMLGFRSRWCSRSAGRRFAFPDRGQSAMRCATSYFVTETRRPGVSPVGIALSVSSPCL